jgi:hypothetical protein
MFDGYVYPENPVQLLEYVPILWCVGLEGLTNAAYPITFQRFTAF